MFYRILNNKLYDYSDIKYSEECLFTDIITQVELDSEPNRVIVAEGILVLNPNYEEVQAEKERKRIMNLNLTKADVLLALYEDKGLTPDDIKAMIKDNIPALIKFDYASSYYRGDEVVNTLGLALGYTADEIDYLFEHKAFPPKPATETIQTESEE